jgi:hypothetical protein
MNSQRMDMWFMAPFDEPQDQNMVDPANSELSPFSSVSSDSPVYTPLSCTLFSGLVCEMYISEPTLIHHRLSQTMKHGAGAHTMVDLKCQTTPQR